MSNIVKKKQYDFVNLAKSKGFKQDKDITIANESLNEAKLNVSDKKGTAKLFADTLKKFGVDVNDVRIEDKNTIVIDFRDIRAFTPKNREPIANAIMELIDKTGRELEMVDWMDEEEDDDRTFPSYVMIDIKE